MHNPRVVYPATLYVICLPTESSFTLKGANWFILSWAMEYGHPTGASLYEGNQRFKADCDLSNSLLQRIADKKWIAADGGQIRKLMN